MLVFDFSVHKKCLYVCRESSSNRSVQIVVSLLLPILLEMILSLALMELIDLVFLLSVFIKDTQTVRIGIINNASLLLANTFNNTINDTTCSDCLCVMLNSRNSSIVSLHCNVKNETAVVCQFWTQTDYDISGFYRMETNLNNTFYFLKLPLTNTSRGKDISRISWFEHFSFTEQRFLSLKQTS